MQSTTWVKKLFNSLSIEEQTNINNTQKLKALTELEQKHVSDQDKRQLIYQRWTRTFSRKHGEFWPFYVENTCYDFPRAQQLRLDLFTQRAFQDHLQQKYGVQWLWKTQETSADCSFLHQMRCDYYDEVERIRQKMEEDEIAEEKLIEDAKNHMKAKVWLKEITQAEYDEWFLLFNATKDYGFELDDWRDYFSGKYRHMDEGDKVLQLLQEQEQNLREFCQSQEEHIQILVQEQQPEEQPPAQFEDAIKKVIHLRRILKEQEDNLRRRQERPDNFMVAIIRTLFDI